MQIVIQPGGGLEGHIQAIGALPETLTDRLWNRVRSPEELGEELIGGDNSYFILTPQHQQGIQTLLVHLQAKYAIVAEWLRHDLCNGPKNDLFNTEEVYYKPYADYIVARFRLCQTIYPELKPNSFPSATGMWVNWVASEVWLELYQLFQGESTYQGKRDWYDFARQDAKPYELQHENNKIPHSQSTKTEALLPSRKGELNLVKLAASLEKLCASKAKADPVFDLGHYQPYLRKQRAFQNAFHKSPHIQIGNVTPKGFEITRKGKQVSKSRKRRKV